ncbi:hypothetical protein V1509DRAFT_657745 [Lipomyces kononenkoae]
MAHFLDLRMVNLSVASSSSSLASYYDNAALGDAEDRSLSLLDDTVRFIPADDEVVVGSKLSKLDKLPTEIYWQICRLFETKAALNNLSLTSKAVRSATLPELYRDVNITPTDRLSLARVAEYLPCYANYIRRITVSAPDPNIDNYDSPLSFTVATGGAADDDSAVAATEEQEIAKSLSRLTNVSSFEWNDCPVVLPAEILTAVLRLPKLVNFQTCSLPPQITILDPPVGSWLLSLRILRLRSLDEARVLNGIVRHCKNTLAYLSIRVAERDELSATVLDDIDTRHHHFHPHHFAWGGAAFAGGFQPNIALPLLQLDPSANRQDNEEDLVTTNLKSMFLKVVFNDVWEQQHDDGDVEDSKLLSLHTLALYNFPRVDLTFLAQRVNFSKLRVLRIDTMDPLVLTTLSQTTVLPPRMKTLDLTFGKAAFPIPPPAPSSADDVVRPPLMATLLRDLRQVEKLNLKLLCEPMRQDTVLSAHIVPWLIGLDHTADNHHKRQHALKKLSIHVWSVSSGHHVLLAAWTLADLHALATCQAGATIKSLAVDLSRGTSPFPDLVTNLKEFKCLRKLYINYAPSVYYGSGVYDVCRRQAAVLKEQVAKLELIWLNSVELRAPYRRRDGADGVFTSTSSARASLSPVSSYGNSRKRCRSPAGALNFEYENGYDYDDDDDDDDIEDRDEHCSDEYFADDGNFNIFASSMI